MLSAARLRQSAPLLLLLSALATLFIFDRAWDDSFRSHEMVEKHDSVKNLLLAENLSPAHNFRLFLRLFPEEEGRPAYEVYSRFPVGGPALIKAAMLPFGDAWPDKYLGARLLMLLLFSAAAGLAWQSLRRITGSPWVALAATLLAFSSKILLIRNNVISNEMSMDLFAVLLVFHGMVIFEQEGRFRQLLVKSCAALLLGWHVYAILLPFILLGLARGFFRADRLRPALRLAGRLRPALRLAGHLRQWAPRLSRESARGNPTDGKAPEKGRRRWNRYLGLGAATLLFGLAVLGFNFYGEYTALQGQVPLTELPSFKSALNRTTGAGSEDFDPLYFAELGWPQFMQGQFLGIGMMSLSRLNPEYGAARLSTPAQSWLDWAVVAAGILATAVALAGLCFSRWRMLLGALALSGFCWALPLRYNTAPPTHSYELMFYVGLPLTLFTLLLWYVNRRWGLRPLVGAGVAAAAVFAFCVFELRPAAPAAAAEADQQAVIADLAAIRPLTLDNSILLDLRPPAGLDGSDQRRYERTAWLYLSGSQVSGGWYIRRSVDRSRPIAVSHLDFVVSYEHHPGVTLTPDNRMVFLYDSADYLNLYRPVISGPPAAESFFNIHRHGGELLYSKAPCAPVDVQDEWFFLHLYPADVNRLPESRQQYGYSNHDFRFELQGAIIGGVCFARIELPEYRIVRIRTGQYTPGQERSWEVEFPVPAAKPETGTP